MGKFLNHIADAFTGNKRQTSDAILSIAQRGRAAKGVLPPEDVLRLCMSVISQARK